MTELNFLFSKLSIEEVIILAIALILAAKVIFTTIEWFWDKIKKKLDIENKQDQRMQSILAKLEELDSKIDQLDDRQYKIREEQQKTHSSLNLVRERLQENTRSYIIDAHHKFCYELHAIDDISLQSVERRYLYYKTAGGNSFIDNLVEEMRELPRVNAYSLIQQSEEDGRLHE